MKIFIKKYIWKFRLQNGSHFVSASQCLTSHEKKMATVTAHRELTATKMVTASRDWAVIELWPSRDWALIILKMLTASCDLAVIELWPRRDWAVT